MGIAKVTLNGTTLMDVTSKTVTSSTMLSPQTALNKAGENITGNITTQSAFPPAITLTSSTGVVTGTNTFAAGYYAASTKTSTLNLTTQAAQTINTSTADQTIASYKWLTGTQTIKSVITSNLTAANIKSGVVVKVGDANNASRITQITGTLQSQTYTIQITKSGNTSQAYVQYNSTKYYTAGNSFSIPVGASITLYVNGLSDNYIAIDGVSVKTTSGSYTYTPSADCNIALTSGSYAEVLVYTSVIPIGIRPGYTITPGTSSKIAINQSYYATGSVYVAGDANLVASKIAFGASIFGVDGTYGSFYNIYKCLANRQLLYASGSAADGYTASEVTNWCNSYQEMSEGQLAAQPFSGEFTFTNLTTIPQAGFGAVLAMAYSRPSYYLNFPQASSMQAAAFYGNKCIRTVSAPNCTNISISAFMSALYLSNVYFPACTSIASSAFQNIMYGLSTETVSFPACVSIAGYAFYNCQQLSAVSFPVCTYIGSSAFYLTNLANADFPKCTYIGNGAFYMCPKLISANFPECTSIMANAFMSCSSLTEINFPKAMVVSNNAFQYCSRLSSVNLSVCSHISNYAFGACTNLSTLSLPACTQIGAAAFLNCANLTTISLSSGASIGYSAFASCSQLTEVIGLNFASIIQMYAFQSCYGLTSIDIQNCSTLEGYAFQYCSNLDTIKLGNLSILGSYTFRSCWRLMSVYLYGSSIPTLGTNVFLSTPISGYSAVTGGRGKIYVPSSLYDTYKTATGWTAYSSIMVSM